MAPMMRVTNAPSSGVIRVLSRATSRSELWILGAMNRTTATLAPFLHAAYVARPVALLRLGEAATAPQAMGGWRPSAGVGALLFFDLLRVDVARGLRDGRWSASVDVGRAFWGVL